MLLSHTKTTNSSIWNGKICIFEVFSFDPMNDFGGYFMKILEKLSTDIWIIINLYKPEKIAENRLINKKCEVY